MPGAGRKPVEPAADRPAAAVEVAGAVPGPEASGQAQVGKERGMANPVEPPGAAVAVALARNPGEPPGADSPGAAVAVRTEIAEALVVGALGHTPAQPVGVQGRYFVSGLQSKHCRTGSAFSRRD